MGQINNQVKHLQSNGEGSDLWAIEIGHPHIRSVMMDVALRQVYTVDELECMSPEEYNEKAYIIQNCILVRNLLNGSGGM